jgi:MFS family permease
VRLPPALGTLAERSFRLLWLGRTTSAVGDALIPVALAFAVLELGGPRDLGIVLASYTLPRALLILAGGVWADRLRRRVVMIAADLVRAALLVSVPVAAAFDVLTFPQLYAVGFAAGTFAVLFDISWSTLFVTVVPRRDVVDANSKLSASRALSFVIGPSLAGFLVQLLTAPVTLLVDAFSFLGSAAFLSRIRAQEPAVERDENGVLGSLRDGFRFVFGDELLRADLGCAATVNLFNFVFHAIFILYATKTLGVAPGTLGIALGAGAVGGILGALVAPRVERVIGIGPSVVVGSLLFPSPLILVPLASGSELTLGLLLGTAEFFSSVGVMIFDVSAASMMFLRTPDRIRARMAGTFRFVNYGIRPIGALLGGALGTAIGLQTTLWIGVVGALAGVIWLLVSPVPRLRVVTEAA